MSLVPLPFACTEKLNVPLCVGVPEMTPFEASVRPGGSVPLASDHEFTVSPVAERAGAVYAWFEVRVGQARRHDDEARRRPVDVDRELLVGEDPGPLPPVPHVYPTVT